jgi:hypothetical protein
MLDAGCKIRNVIMSFKFEKLTIWQDSMDLVKKFLKFQSIFKRRNIQSKSQIRRI